MRKILAVGVASNIVSGVGERLKEAGAEVTSVASAKEAFDFIKKQKVSLIILNNLLFDVEDYREFCISIRSLEKTTDLPIILLAQKQENIESKIEALRAGLVNDYIALPAHIEEIAARVNVFIELRMLQEELELKNILLKNISITDEVTKVYNRWYLLDRITEEIEYVKRYNCPFSCLMIDLDYFKKINDQFGHPAGDCVLKELAHLLKNSIRKVDIIGRYGGEEFFLILPHTNLEGALILAERLRNKAMSYDFCGSNEPLKVTLSIGVVSFSSSDALTLTRDEVIKKTDEMLYLAKKNGRNRVEAALFSREQKK